MINFYDLLMRPIESNVLNNIRQPIISKAYGKVLELGVGTGVNLPLYDVTKITDLVGLDVKITKTIKEKSVGKMSLVEGSAERLPFEDNTFDTVVATLVLCSVPDYFTAIKEIKRVMKKDGQYIFLEHILPSNSGLAYTFKTVNKVWSKYTQGCHIDRVTDITLRENFNINNFNKAMNGVLCYGIAYK